MLPLNIKLTTGNQNLKSIFFTEYREIMLPLHFVDTRPVRHG